MLVIGGSAGSLDVILKILPQIKLQLNFPIVTVLHRKKAVGSSLTTLYSYKTSIPVREIEEKDPIAPGTIYIAPADYHLLFEKDNTFALDSSEKINYSRPSIDLCFESAAEVYRDRVVALLLSGANADGAEGLKTIKSFGGITAVQDPKTAEVAYMPQQGILKAPVDYILKENEIVTFINNFISA